MNLYQHSFGSQPHYVVADSYGAAERMIIDEGYRAPARIEFLGPYVLVQAMPCGCAGKPEDTHDTKPEQ